MTQYIERPGGRIAYDLTGPGDGQLVACVPGMGDRRQAFRFLVPPLASLGYRVATMDLRGHGESSTGWPAHSATTIASDVSALVDHLGAPVTLIAHSFGCAAAVDVTAQRPDTIDRLVLISTSAGDRRIPPPVRLAARIVGRSPILWARYYRSQFPTNPPDDLDAYVAVLRSLMADRARRAALKALFDEAFGGVPLRYGDVVRPVLVVFGEQDREVRDARSEADAVLAKLGAPATVEILSACGHYPHIESPEATTEAVLRFLRAPLPT